MPKKRSDVDDSMAANPEAAGADPSFEESDTPFPGGNLSDEIALETDFNVQEEYKEPPLIPNGTYYANVTDVKFDGEQQAIVFTWTLVDNGGVLSDGETPVDGSTIWSRVWLPREGDDTEMTKDNRMTKRAAKVSMMKRFSDKVKISMNTKADIIDGVVNQAWLGTSAKLKIVARTYEGRIFNDVKDFVQ